MTFYEEQKEISGLIKRSIDDYCESKSTKKFRRHLGGSVIGNECLRALWYGFRWAKVIKHSGQKLRLFNRGHREEEILIDYLRGIGFDVQDFQKKVLIYHPESDFYWIDTKFDGGDGLAEDVTGHPKHEAIAKGRGLNLSPEQFRVSACNGHFGGSLDGIVSAPEGIPLNYQMILELKTVNHKYFTPLFKKSVKEVFPAYFAQMCVYGKLIGLRHALFVAVNKQNDEIYIEIVKLDWNHGEELLKKAEEVITAETPPKKIGKRSSFFKCKMCNYSNLCWGVAESATTIKNCRCCNRAKPVENGQWYCIYHKGIIPEDFFLTACQNYRNITYTL